MGESYDAERREFVRVPCSIFVRYKFLAQDMKDPELDRIYEGTTNNISGGGLLLAGPMPKKDWIAALLTHRMVIGVNMLVPNVSEPVRALTRLVWIEAMDEKTRRCAMGVTFKEITTGDRDRILKYIVQAQLPA